MTSRARSPRASARRVLGRRSTWTVACGTIALPFFVAGRGLELVPFVLALVAGWLAGMSFVDGTARARRPWRGVVVHGVGAVAVAALLVWSIGPGAGPLSDLSGPVRGAVLLAQVGALTGVCWTWLGLLARGITALPDSRAGRPTGGRYRGASSSSPTSEHP